MSVRITKLCDDLGELITSRLRCAKEEKPLKDQLKAHAASLKSFNTSGQYVGRGNLFQITIKTREVPFFDRAAFLQAMQKKYKITDREINRFYCSREEVYVSANAISREQAA